MNNKIWKKIGVVLAGILILFLISGILIQIVFGNSIKQLIIKKLNQSLAAELVVKGDIDFTVFKSFPYVAVEFNNVDLKEGISKSKKSLLVAEKLALQFNILSIINGTNNIQRVKITNSSLFIRIDEKGTANYFIMKNDSSTGKSENSVNVSIDKILVENMNLTFEDKYNNQSYSILIKDSKLSGNFSAYEFDLTIAANTLINKLVIQDIEYVNNKQAKIDIGLYIDTKKGNYQFKDGSIKIDEADFKVRGLVKDLESKYDLDLFIAGDDIGLEELGSILPNSYTKYLNSLDTRGNLMFTGTIKGPLSRKQNPSVDFRFDIKNATIKSNNSSQKIEKVNCNASYSNGIKRSWRNSEVKIRNGNAIFNGKPFSYDLLITNFSNPNLALKLNGTIDLKILAPFISNQNNFEMNGELQLINFSFRGLVNDISNQSNIALQSEGSIKATDVSILTDAITINKLSGIITSSSNLLLIQESKCMIGSTDISLSGEIKNLIPFIFKSISSRNNSSYSFDVSIVSNNFNSKDFYSKSDVRSDSIKTSMPLFISNAYGKADVKIKNLEFDKIKASNFNTSIKIINQKFYFNNLQLNAIDGSLLANGNIDISNPNYIILESTLKLDNMNINTLFIQFNNFDQNALTDKNIKGILSSSCYLKAIWNNGIFSNDDFIAIADIAIDKGELNEFKPLYSLSKFIKVKDLEKISFSKLSNQIEIRNKVVNIPTTIISTNVLTMELKGTHTFDNYIDYKIKLNFLQLLSNKFKSTNTFNPDDAESDKNGLINLYILMKGPADNPKIIYDKTSVKKVIQQSVQEEKKALKDILKKEFTQQEYQQQQIKDWKEPDTYELIDFDSDSTQNL